MTTPVVRVLGLPVNLLTRDELVTLLASWTAEREGRSVLYANAHTINSARENRHLMSAFQKADLVTCDGFGARLAARLLGGPPPERLTSIDWIDGLLSRLSDTGESVFLVGDADHVVRAAAGEMQRRHPLIKVAGTHHGYFEPQSAESDELVRVIAASSPGLILVGTGTPRQELWIQANASAFDCGTALAVGSMFRWYTGLERRAPRWLAQSGMEWLWRLGSHPISLFGRYVTGNMQFAVAVLSEAVKGRR